jgi:myo-inositol-1(or 4)-monophosphatase
MRWEKLLNEACLKATEEIKNAGERGRKYVGLSPSGDRTLLADVLSEKAIINVISSLESVSFVSEESGESGSKDSRYTAVIDPLDGSSNYLRGIPFYCISIAIYDNMLGCVDAGCVYDIVNESFYYAEKRKISTKNGSMISCSTKKEIDDSVLAIDPNYMKQEEISKLSRLIASAGRCVHLGANALELCYVAEGKIDGFIDVRGMIRQTDVAAAFLVVRRAGGIVSDQNGKMIKIFPSAVGRLSMVASCTPEIHKQIIRLLKS